MFASLNAHLKNESWKKKESKSRNVIKKKKTPIADSAISCKFSVINGSCFLSQAEKKGDRKKKPSRDIFVKYEQYIMFSKH